MNPPLKWAGGKRWLAPSLLRLLERHQQRRLVEPFAGSGALFFMLEPRSALLAEINGELIATYRAIRDSAPRLAYALRRLEICQEVFESMRVRRPRTDLSKATRLIYLNRTAFGGLWRVNQMGHFNVPFGCKPETKLPDIGVLSGPSKLLKRATLVVSDFEDTLARVRASDIVYCDPPYTVSHNDNGFIRYNERIFSWQHQQRLAARCNQLAANGLAVIVSNALHADIVKLYDPKAFVSLKVGRPSNLAADGQKRVLRHELLLISKNLTSTQRDLPNLLDRPSFPVSLLQVNNDV